MKLPRPNFNKILPYYSVFLMTALLIGGLWQARAANEIVSNILLLPVAIFLWMTIIDDRRRYIKKLNGRERLAKSFS